MKFEIPTAEIEKFELEDVISTSTGGDDWSAPPDTDVHDQGLPCTHRASDTGDTEPCFY